jgi:hypothetical protein
MLQSTIRLPACWHCSRCGRKNVCGRQRIGGLLAGSASEAEATDDLADVHLTKSTSGQPRPSRTARLGACQGKVAEEKLTVPNGEPKAVHSGRILASSETKAQSRHLTRAMVRRVTGAAPGSTAVDRPRRCRGKPQPDLRLDCRGDMTSAIDQHEVSAQGGGLPSHRCASIRGTGRLLAPAAVCSFRSAMRRAAICPRLQVCSRCWKMRVPSAGG